MHMTQRDFHSHRSISLIRFTWQHRWTNSISSKHRHATFFLNHRCQLNSRHRIDKLHRPIFNHQRYQRHRHHPSPLRPAYRRKVPRFHPASFPPRVHHQISPSTRRLMQQPMAFHRLSVVSSRRAEELIRRRTIQSTYLPIRSCNSPTPSKRNLPQVRTVQSLHRCNSSNKPIPCPLTIKRWSKLDRNEKVSSSPLLLLALLVTEDNSMKISCHYNTTHCNSRTVSSKGNKMRHTRQVKWTTFSAVHLVDPATRLVSLVYWLSKYAC